MHDNTRPIPSATVERILVVEDDIEFSDLLTNYLKEQGYEVTSCPDVPSARKQLEIFRPEICLLDIMMPGPSGKVLCREIAERTDTAVIMMSSISDSETVIALLELGADDYIIKPYLFPEMNARIRAVMRRRIKALVGASKPNMPHKIGPWSLRVRDRKLLHDDGFTVALTPSETETLRFLLSSPGTVFSREDLLAVARTRQHNGTDDRAVDNLMRRLRKKLEENPADPQFLLTEWGKGYRLAV